ncbi:efflux RND transporter periplasmic adaptor subunit [Paracoccus suum]|uniref:Efflux RND transporter periplasmic adaptor subunit n=2 Tax=Paracoccus suum TaxID=2259340 RepID=A0A344PNJ8_9RHOB|nr:efflux RND transporter periplasmic adaptor subunit [Paracoccus suum]
MAQAAQHQPAPATAKAEDGQVTARPAAATVEDAVVSEVLAQVPVSGTLVARQEVQIFPQVQGFEITELLVEPGDRVEKGQLLARLSDATLKAQLAQAEAEYQRAEAGLSQSRSQIASAAASLNQATSALERVQRLQRSGNASQATLDQAVSAEASARAAAASAGDGVAVAQAQVAQAEAARDIARLNVERTEIKAPVAGVVSNRTAELGAIAASGAQPLFTMTANGQIEVAGEVIETALEQLKVGDPALMRVAGVGDVTGEVRLVPASVDPVTRLGIVRVSLEANPALRTGLFASGWITTERRDAVTVPAGAILASDDPAGGVVQVVKNDRIETRPVRAGLLWDGRREIIEGLAAGETVLARAAAFFSNGDPVEPVRAGAAEPALQAKAPAPETVAAAPKAEPAAPGKAP